MRVGIATDHGGFGLKEELLTQLRNAGHEVVDFGAHRLTEGDDYPDYVTPLAQAVAAGKVDRGVAICGSGVGASVCVNKVHGIRAGLIHDHFSARQGVEDDHMNVLCYGRQDRRTGRGLGPRPDVPASRVQPSRTTPAPPGQSGFFGSRKNIAKGQVKKARYGMRDTRHRISYTECQVRIYLYRSKAHGRR